MNKNNGERDYKCTECGDDEVWGWADDNICYDCYMKTDDSAVEVVELRARSEELKNMLRKGVEHMNGVNNEMAKLKAQVEKLQKENKKLKKVMMQLERYAISILER